MVKRVMEPSVFEDDGDAMTLNENSKRPVDEQNNDTKKRIKTKSLYRQPTINELNRLQETENLFNSNLFRLQVEEILQEVQVKEKTEKRFQQWFTEFKTYLESIPADTTEYNLSEPTLLKKLKVKLPVSSELSKTRCTFKFYRFKDVKIVGSYSLGCPINSKLIVDLQISIPAETYTKNDSINYRYHKKRAAYLAYIASYLTKSVNIQNLQYTWLEGCEVKPVLDFKPTGKLGNNLSVRINLVCEEESYKLHRFSPVRNNLREAWLLNTEGENSDFGTPTPYYNSMILSDLSAEANQALLNEILLQSENLKQAVILLKIWLRQRDLQVSGHIVNMVVAYFVQAKRINNIMSSYQIVRNVWIALKSSEWDTKGITLHKGTDKTPTLEEFHQHFPVVFIDKTGYYNICWQMSKGTYYALRRESSLAVDMLDNPKINSFIPLFMTPVKALMKFDHILRFRNLQNIKQTVIDKSSKESRLYYGLDQLTLVSDTILSLLIKGLGNRADLIQPMVEADFSWPVKKKPDKEEGYVEKLSFGLILNPEHAMNAVEKGPAANLPEAEQFRAFWGDKSELRRFQDGSITETCVWEAETASDRRGITKQILNYLLQLKFGIEESEVYHVSDQLDVVLSRKRFAMDPGADAQEAAARALRAFDDLRRDLRQLADLPLSIAAVYGVSPVFSYSDPLPPLPRPPATNPWRRGDAALIKTIDKQDGTALLPEYVPASEAVLELGHSGKWPGDIQAFRCLKAAFHLQISTRLREQYSLPSQAYPTHIDVLKNGLVFRLKIAHPKEITLLRRQTENGVVKHKDNEESIKLQKETVLLPRLRGALHGLNQQYPAYGPTACLLKRWLSAHLLCGHVPDGAAELLTAAAFLHAAPASPAFSPTLGLLRVLALLAKTDWATDVLVVDFNDMTREEISDLERKLREGESPCMKIVTAYDDVTPSIWTAGQPTAPVLARVTALATSALHYVHKQLMEDFGDHLLGAFIPSLSGYDVLIHLLPTLVPHVGERVDKKPTLRRMQTELLTDVIPVVNFHPVVKYLDELRNAYNDFALFFHDQYGGEVIAVLWKPDVHELKDLRVSNANALHPVTVNGETKYKVNLAALVEDFRVMGEGIVKNIVVN